MFAKENVIYFSCAAYVSNVHVFAEEWWLNDLEQDHRYMDLKAASKAWSSETLDKGQAFMDGQKQPLVGPPPIQARINM